MFTIARNDFIALFRTPFGWSLLASSQILLGLSYFLLLSNYFNKIKYQVTTHGVSYEIAALLVAVLIYISLFLVPLLALRLLAFERNNHSINLLFTAPISSWRIVLGKFSAMLIFIFCIICLLSLMIIVLSWSSSLEWAKVTLTLAAGFLLLASYCAIAFYISSIIKQPLIAGFASSLCLLFFLLIDFLANTRIDWLDSIINYLSLIRHFENLIHGLASSSDILFFIIVIALFLKLSQMRINRIRFEDV